MHIFVQFSAFDYFLTYSLGIYPFLSSLFSTLTHSFAQLGDAFSQRGQQAVGDPHASKPKRAAIRSLLAAPGHEKPCGGGSLPPSPVQCTLGGHRWGGGRCNAGFFLVGGTTMVNNQTDHIRPTNAIRAPQQGGMSLLKFGKQSSLNDFFVHFICFLNSEGISPLRVTAKQTMHIVISSSGNTFGMRHAKKLNMWIAQHSPHLKLHCRTSTSEMRDTGRGIA